jgi:glycosyltransferase involved in cell wall biosynthesis
MNIFLGMISYNAGALIEAAISSVYDHVDKIILVDGSAFGPSTDETVAIAKSCGPKVFAVLGTFAVQPGQVSQFPVGAWDEQAQRGVYHQLFPQDVDNWLLYMDADEVFDEENIKRLIGYLRNAPRDVHSYTYNRLHFVHDLHHVMAGKHWTDHRPSGVFRLWSALPDSKERVPLDDVMLFHYGLVLPSEERLEFRVRQYFTRGEYKGYGQTEEEWLRFWKAHGNDNHPAGSLPPDAVLFTGEHPAPIKKLGKKIWKDEVF